MLSDQEIQFHRSFLSLSLSLKIWNEDYTHQNTRGGPPGRQYKIDSNSDPVFNYHVRQGPHWPSKPPGDEAAGDIKYNALLAHDDGSFESLVITTKRGMTGQNFFSAATPWEIINSVMCPFGGKFIPVVNSMMEVTGHFANVIGDSSRILDGVSTYLVHPKGISFKTPSDYITNDVPLYLWKDINVPEGWERFSGSNGGIDVVVLPDGEVVGALGHPFSSNNGTTYSVISPIDFWAPGSRMAAAGIRAVTNRISAAAVKGFRAIRIPTRKLAERVVSKLAPGNTLTGMAVTRALPIKTVGRRTIIMADDMAHFETQLAKTTTESGFFDVVIHGDTNSFYILQNGAWKNLSVSEVAAAIRTNLAPGDKIRLLACKSGVKGGPAQQLANELQRTVWAPNATVYPVHGKPIWKEPAFFGLFGGKRKLTFKTSKSFVPDGGKFYEFVPQRGVATYKGMKATGDELSGEIVNAR